MIIPLWPCCKGCDTRAHSLPLTHKHAHAHTHTHTHTQDDIFADQHVGPVFNDDGIFSCVANVLLMCC